NIAAMESWWGKEKVIPGGRKVPEGFEYSSGTNPDWLGTEELRKRLGMFDAE
ncbi:MAG: hypothetical protein HFH52_11585, partial [Lachnospiraceae bacterium]|nr:hypothetical protein [Lachnospiraceae bacterium]